MPPPNVTAMNGRAASPPHLLVRTVDQIPPPARVRAASPLAPRYRTKTPRNSFPNGETGEIAGGEREPFHQAVAVRQKDERQAAPRAA